MVSIFLLAPVIVIMENYKKFLFLFTLLVYTIFISASHFFYSLSVKKKTKGTIFLITVHIRFRRLLEKHSYFFFFHHTIFFLFQLKHFFKKRIFHCPYSDPFIFFLNDTMTKELLSVLPRNYEICLRKV